MTPIERAYLEITERILAANELERRGRFVEAMESFLVAADLAEEANDDRARRLRGRARRIAVFLEASRRWPSDVTDLAQVTGAGAEPSRGEIVTFWITDVHGAVVRRVVRIDRRGRLRVMEGPR